MDAMHPRGSRRAPTDGIDSAMRRGRSAYLPSMDAMHSVDVIHCHALRADIPINPYATIGMEFVGIIVTYRGRCQNAPVQLTPTIRYQHCPTSPGASVPLPPPTPYGK